MIKKKKDKKVGSVSYKLFSYVSFLEQSQPPVLQYYHLQESYQTIWQDKWDGPL